MSSITISPWRRKTNRPRYYISDGRAALGVIFEAKGVFSAVDRDGNLILASTALQTAANALVPATGASS
jgi:hypothetical protein